jgi:hypothetical protein
MGDGGSNSSLAIDPWAFLFLLHPLCCSMKEVERLAASSLPALVLQL